MSSISNHLNKNSFIKWNLFCSFPGPGLYCRAQLMLLCVIQISQYSFFDLKLAAQFILIQKKMFLFQTWMFNIQVWNSTSVTENKEHQNRLPLKKNHIYMVVSLQDIFSYTVDSDSCASAFLSQGVECCFSVWCCKDTLKEFLSVKAIKEEWEVQRITVIS